MKGLLLTFVILAFLSLVSASPLCSSTLEPGDHVFTFELEDIEREYVLHVPAVQKESYPLVIALHGMGANNPTIFQNAIEMDAIAEREGFIVAYPLGSPSVSTGLFGHTWNGGELGRQKPEEAMCCLSKHDDVAYIRHLVGLIQKQMCIESNRVYAFGFSAGGVMSHRLGCECSDIIRAFASLSGPIQNDCEDLKIPYPVLTFHGTLDPIFPFGGLNPLFTGAVQTFHNWSRRNNCTGEAEITYEDGRVSEQTYLSCASNVTVSLVVTKSGGHSWPPSRFISAEEHIWKFFDKYR